jgi:hypothetical protein
MNLTEVKKSLERQFDRELAQGSKCNIVFWYITVRRLRLA